MRDVTLPPDWTAHELVTLLDGLEHLSQCVWREYKPDIIDQSTWRVATDDLWTGSEALVVITFLQDAKDAAGFGLGQLLGQHFERVRPHPRQLELPLGSTPDAAIPF